MHPSTYEHRLVTCSLQALYMAGLQMARHATVLWKHAHVPHRHVPVTVGTLNADRTAILFAGMDVSSFVHDPVRVAHICMRALCQQLIHRHYTRSASKHGRCAAQAIAPTCLLMASMSQCNRAGRLWRLSVGAFVCTGCTHSAGRCRPFLEGPDSYVWCAWSIWTPYVGSTMLWQGALFARYVRRNTPTTC